MHLDFIKIQEVLVTLLIEMKDEGHMLYSDLFPSDPIDDTEVVSQF